MPAPASMVPSMPMLMMPERSHHKPVVAPKASGVASTSDSLNRLTMLVLGLSDRARLSTSSRGITASALKSRAGLAHRRVSGGANPSTAVSKNSTPMATTQVGGWNPIPAGSGGGSKLNRRLLPLIAGATPASSAMPSSPNTSPVIDWRFRPTRPEAPVAPAACSTVVMRFSQTDSACQLSGSYPRLAGQ